MKQPLVRTKLTHDPASMEGQAYLLPAVAITVDVATSGSGVTNIYTVPAGTWLVEAQAILLEALDVGTLDIGLDGDTDALIDNTEWNEQTQYAVASSKQTTAPDGIYFSAQDNLAVEFAGAGSGKVLILLWLLNVSDVQLAVHSAL